MKSITTGCRSHFLFFKGKGAGNPDQTEPLEKEVSLDCLPVYCPHNPFAPYCLLQRPWSPTLDFMDFTDFMNFAN
jgi:hypothetical protein